MYYLFLLATRTSYICEILVILLRISPVSDRSNSTKSPFCYVSYLLEAMNKLVAGPVLVETTNGDG